MLVAMNLVYAISAYPFGKLSDSMSHTKLLVLAYADSWNVVFLGVALWGLHMGITKGLLATMVADTAPADLRGTVFGFFNLLSGLTMLVASALAGLLWDQLGASFTFYAGIFFGVFVLAAIAVKELRGVRRELSA